MIIDHISILDLLFFAYLILCLYRGSKAGLGKELEKLINTLLFLAGLLGIFIISLLSGLINTTLQLTLFTPGMLLSLSSFMAALFVFFFLRKKINLFCESEFPHDLNHYAGSLVGLLRGLSLIAITVLFLTYLPFGWFSESRQHSYLSHSMEKLMLPLSEPSLPASSENVPSTTTSENTENSESKDQRTGSEELLIGY